ncbi:unnamed protein product [Citrullus colocynthis]|uniref:Uncharacterized protein n=1 Tax=Citrullus colocynthis TaxID=252529 RepID=A0ABP0YPB8_9ROSI
MQNRASLSSALRYQKRFGQSLLSHSLYSKTPSDNSISLSLSFIGTKKFIYIHTKRKKSFALQQLLGSKPKLGSQVFSRNLVVLHIFFCRAFTAFSFHALRDSNTHHCFFKTHTIFCR